MTASGKPVRGLEGRDNIDGATRLAPK